MTFHTFFAKNNRTPVDRTKLAFTNKHESDISTVYEKFVAFGDTFENRFYE